MKNESSCKLAVWAGEGSLPLTAAQNAARQKEVLVIGFRETTDIQPYQKAGLDVRLISLGEMGRNFRILQTANVKELVMLGKFPRSFIFGKSAFDLTGIKLLLALANARDMSIFRLLAGELKKRGIEVIPQTRYLDGFIAENGCLTKRKPDKTLLQDIKYGFHIAKTVAELDIGQTIVVRHESVIAIESLEGTNETIRRIPAGIGKQAVVIKTARRKQDLRFDIPVVGIETLSIMLERNIKTIAVEAGKTILADKTDLVRFADRKGICIWGI